MSEFATCRECGAVYEGVDRREAQVMADLCDCDGDEEDG
jgi:hypothetical protein